VCIFNNPGKEICWSASSQKRVYGDSSLGSPEDARIFENRVREMICSGELYEYWLTPC